MSRRAGLTLIGLLAISLLVAAITIWLFQRIGDLPMSRPGFGAPWHYHGIEPRAPWQGEPHLPGWRPPFWSTASPWWLLGKVLASEAFLFLASAVLLMLFPARLHRILAALAERKNAGRLLGLGVLTGVFLLVLSLLAVFSFIGLPFLPGLFLLVAFVWMVGLVAVTLRVGGAVRNAARLVDRQPLLDLALGVLTLFIVGSIPIAGGLALLLAGLWGMGAVAATRFGSSHGWQLDALAEMPL